MLHMAGLHILTGMREQFKGTRLHWENAGLNYVGVSSRCVPYNNNKPEEAALLVVRQQGLPCMEPISMSNSAERISSIFNFWLCMFI